MFLGTFSPALASTGQVALPTKLRSALGSDRAIITTGFDKCVNGFSIEDWKRIVDQEILNRPISSEEGRKVRHQMFANAVEIDLDEQGRFVIPEVLRKFAGVKEGITFVGAGDHFEIWDKDEWLSYSSTFK
jgi:MraZ protein